MAAAGDPSPLQFLQEELSSDNPQQCIQCISRLRVIGLALGHEKVRNELLPYLTESIEQVSDGWLPCVGGWIRTA
jgi:hypothetical protein